MRLLTMTNHVRNKHTVFLLGWIVLASLFTFAAESALNPQPDRHVLQAHLGADGSLTFFMLDPRSYPRDLAVPPEPVKNAELVVFPTPLIDLNDRVKSVYNGQVHCYTKIISAEGG